MKEAYFNWSSGKDSALSLFKVQETGEYRVALLITTLAEKLGRISMHGLREELLDAQVTSIGIPLGKVRLPEMPTMEAYNTVMERQLEKLKTAGLEYALFGDIFLEDLRRYREEQLQQRGVQAVFPLWKRDTRELIHEFIDLGFRAITVCVDERVLDRSFLGRIIDHDFLKDLPQDVDPCGENGEYHSFVFDGPLFKDPVGFTQGETVYKKYDDPTTGGKHKTGFWYQDLRAIH